MASTSYPSASDLQTYLTEIGITQTISVGTKSNALAEAIEWAETFTGRVFITSDISETRKYDVCGPQNGYVICEIQDANTITTVSVGTGSALTLDADYELLPINPRTGWAYDGIRFLKSSPYGPRNVNVTGKFGWAAVPGSVQQSIMQYAAGTISAGIGAGAGGSAIRRKIGDREVEYARTSNNFGSGAGAELKKSAMLALSPYVRVPYV